ncbi:hypothetical protein Gotri_000063, partial [Gossypium trilobum]|nr:hypothetical protein [Gossypium trilobum]
MAEAEEQHTKVKLINSCGHTLSLSGHHVWEGSHTTAFPETILDGDSSQFTHVAGHADGSSAALAYELRDDGKKWVVAWSNPRGANTKVHTDIIDDHVNWEQVRIELETSNTADSETVRSRYKARESVDHPTEPSPTVTASLKKRSDDT